MRRYLRHGFTLVEIIAALVVISILTGLILVSVGSARDKSLQTRLQGDIEKINLAKGEWQLDNVGAAFPTDESQRFTCISSYLQVAKMEDLAPANYTYLINALGISASASSTKP